MDGETGKGRTNNEAKGEPRIRLDDRSGVVTAVVAAADQAFVALHLAAEGVLATGEDDAHGIGVGGLRGGCGVVVLCNVRDPRMCVCDGLAMCDGGGRQD